MKDRFLLSEDAIRFSYTPELSSFCKPFSCSDEDLDDFFAHEALLYDKELLGKTYIWVKAEDPKHILGMKRICAPH